MAAGATTGRGRVAALAFLLALALLALVVLRAYQVRRDHTVVAEVPLLRADPSPVRERPADPGGMKVPFQDTLLFEALGDAPAEPRVERLLPPPEEPLDIAERAAPPVADTPQAAAAAPEESEAAADSAPPALTPPPPPPAPETTAALAPTAAPPPEPATGFRVQLGSFRSPEEAARGWDRVRAQAPELLEELGHIVARVDLGPERGVFHRVQAGPFPTRDSADSLCGQLKAREMDCFVVGP